MRNANPHPGPATSHAAVNAVPYTVPSTWGRARGLYVGTAGDVVLVAPDGTSATYPAADKQTLDVCFTAVGNGTTATGLVALR